MLRGALATSIQATILPPTFHSAPLYSRLLARVSGCRVGKSLRNRLREGVHGLPGHKTGQRANDQLFVRIYLRILVGAAGLEPATTCLEGRCSIHLSYAPGVVLRRV